LAQEVPLILSIADSEKFKTPCEKDQLPMITQSMTGNPLYPAGWIYGIYMPWWESFAVWCEWILDNWKEDRPPKIVVIGPDTTAGPIAVEPAIPYVERMGAEVLQPEYVSGYAPLDSSTQLMRIERNGADFVYILPIWTISSVVLKDAERLGLVGKVRFGGMENTQSPKLIEAAQSAADGYTAPRFAPYIGETDIEGIQMIRDLRSRYGRGVGFAGDDAHGFVTAVVGCEAIKRAVERVGYENLNGAAVKEALDSMKDWDVYGIKTITYSADDVRGWTGVRIYEIQSGQIVPVSDWVEAPSIVP